MTGRGPVPRPDHQDKRAATTFVVFGPSLWSREPNIHGCVRRVDRPVASERGIPVDRDPRKLWTVEGDIANRPVQLRSNMINPEKARNPLVKPPQRRPKTDQATH